MLVILRVIPVTAPLEAGLGKEFETEVVVIDLVGEVPVTITIGFTRGGLDEERAILENLIIRIIERIDIDSQSASVFRQVGGTSDGTIAEAR